VKCSQKNVTKTKCESKMERLALKLPYILTRFCVVFCKVQILALYKIWLGCRNFIRLENVNASPVVNLSKWESCVCRPAPSPATLPLVLRLVHINMEIHILAVCYHVICKQNRRVCCFLFKRTSGFVLWTKFSVYWMRVAGSVISLIEWTVTCATLFCCG
jgi:hypothetical protein